VIQGLGGSRLLSGAATVWIGSPALGGLIGAAGGFLLGKIDAFPTAPAAGVGAIAGVLAALAVRGVRRGLRARPDARDAKDGGPS